MGVFNHVQHYWMAQSILRSVAAELAVRFSHAQPVGGAEPKPAVAGLQDAMHLVRREAVLFAEVFEPRHNGKREGRSAGGRRRSPQACTDPREERSDKRKAREGAGWGGTKSRSGDWGRL